MTIRARAAIATWSSTAQRLTSAKMMRARQRTTSLSVRTAGPSLRAAPAHGPTGATGSRRLGAGHRHPCQQLGDDAAAVHVLHARGGADDDAVGERGSRQLLHVVGEDEIAPVERCPGAGRVVERS